jgi:hypothetical protein
MDYSITEFNLLTESDLDKVCDLYFSTIPVKFKARRGNKLEEMMVKLIKKENFTLPVIHVKNFLYLIGINRLTCELKHDQVMVRVGGGAMRFESYVKSNQR